FLCSEELGWRFHLDAYPFRHGRQLVLVYVETGGPVVRQVLAEAEPITVFDQLLADLLQRLGSLFTATDKHGGGDFARRPPATVEVPEPFGWRGEAGVLVGASCE